MMPNWIHDIYSYRLDFYVQPRLMSIVYDVDGISPYINLTENVSKKTNLQEFINNLGSLTQLVE